MRDLIVIFFVLYSLTNFSQELNCKVTINADQIQNSNTQVYKTLEKAVTEYINNTKWTNKNYKPQERIDCSITINILEQPSSNDFLGNIQVQVSRPVYNSAYKSSIFNYNDNDVSFVYNEFQPLVYNENSYSSNLVSLLTFYVYTILGIDADTFAKNGGQEYHQKAQNVVVVSQQSGKKGWNSNDGNTSRYQLNENILSPAFQDYRDALYEYHIKGLDKMAENKKEAKNNISTAVLKMQKVYNRRINAFLLRVFMDSKSDEIVDIFSDGPNTKNAVLKEVLFKIYPSFNTKWEKIKI